MPSWWTTRVPVCAAALLGVAACATASDDPGAGPPLRRDAGALADGSPEDADAPHPVSDDVGLRDAGRDAAPGDSAVGTDAGADLGTDVGPLDAAPETPGGRCGNGTVDGGEECDDGNLVDGDGCSASCVVECPGGSKVPTTHHCYVARGATADWNGAKAGCPTIAADFHLATVTSDAEGTFVAALGADGWLGAWDGKGDTDSSRGTYAWVDAEPFVYTHWKAGEPSNSKHSCGFLGLGTCHYEHCLMTFGDAQWNDTDCRDSRVSVCERDPAGVKP